MVQYGLEVDVMGYIKTYRNSKNKINPSEVDLLSNTSLGATVTLQWTYNASSSGRTIRIPCKANTQYIIKPYGDALSSTIWRIATCTVDDVPTASVSPVPVQTIVSSNTPPINGTYMWTGSAVKYIVVQITSATYTDIDDLKTMIALYEVSGQTDPTPITCEPYNTTAWYDWIKRKTASGWTDGENKLYDGGWTPTNRQLGAEKAALTRKINSLKQDAGEE